MRYTRLIEYSLIMEAFTKTFPSLGPKVNDGRPYTPPKKYASLAFLI